MVSVTCVIFESCTKVVQKRDYRLFRSDLPDGPRVLPLVAGGRKTAEDITMTSTAASAAAALLFGPSPPPRPPTSPGCTTDRLLQPPSPERKGAVCFPFSSDTAAVDEQ